MAYPSPQVSRPKGPRTLMIVGAVAAVVGLLLTVGGALLLGTGLFDTFDALLNRRERLAIEVEVPGRGEVHLEPGSYDVVVIGDDLTRRDGRGSDPDRVRRGTFREPTVTVRPAGGDALVLQEPKFDLTFSSSSYDMVSIKSFRVTTAGTYVVEVNGEPGPVESVGIGDASDLNAKALAAAFGGLVVFGLGLLALVPGIGMLIGGVIWWVVVRNRDAASPPWPPGPPGPFPPPGSSTMPPPPPPPPPGQTDRWGTPGPGPIS